MFLQKIAVKRILTNRSNLKCNIISTRNFRFETQFTKYICLIRNISVSDLSTTVTDVKNWVNLLEKNENILRSIKYKICTSSFKWKTISAEILQLWAKQYECIIVQQLRKSQRMFHVYTRIWEEKLIREFIKHLKHHMNRRSKVLLGASGFSAYNWNAHKITDEEIYQNYSEFDYVNTLRENTIICRRCRQRQVIDSQVPNSTYCKCPCKSKNQKNEVLTYEEWAPFLERPNIIVWRRQQESGIYEYKVYGKYNDVSAEDFLYVQIDTKYRQTWDTTAIVLDVVDAHPESKSDILYWEMLWPRLFANRDYVFNRRYMVDEEHKLITVISKTTEHNSCPAKKDKYRVLEYWSCMIIRPTTDLKSPGIEFVLTYFDNPGVNLPSTVTTWVAMAAMPDFLMRLRQAARNYEAYRNNKRDNPKDLKPASNVVVVTPEPESVTQESDGSRSYWRYLHPLYYLG